MDNNNQQKSSREQAFVSFVIERMKTDSAFGAILRRADNPATEYQSWEHLSKWCDLEKPWERHAFATIAASLARSKPKSNGITGIGRAIALCYDDGNKSDSAKAKLRRLLACTNTEEACLILRTVLSLIMSKGIQLDYARLLDEILYFNERVRIHWATDFYGKGHQDDSLSI